jgi:hypothetical protein
MVLFTYKTWRWDVSDMQSAGFFDHLSEAELFTNTSLEFEYPLSICGSVNVEIISFLVPFQENSSKRRGHISDIQTETDVIFRYI